MTCGIENESTILCLELSGSPETSSPRCLLLPGGLRQSATCHIRPLLQQFFFTLLCLLCEIRFQSDEVHRHLKPRHSHLCTEDCQSREAMLENEYACYPQVTSPQTR